jgi:beta-lactam-binding protein with PASTA domain
MSIKDFFKKIASPLVWGNLLAMLLVVVLLCFGLIWWLDWYTHHDESIDVPDFVSLDYTRAIELGDQNGLVVMANDSTFDKKLPARCVVSQQPVAGMKVKQGRIVYVTINSLTMPRVAIPDVIDNCSFREAQAKLQALEFKLTSPKLIDGEKDWVYGVQCDGRNLRTGDLVAKESTLTLVIGNGQMEDELELEEIMLEGDSTGTDVQEDDIDTFLEVYE